MEIFVRVVTGIVAIVSLIAFSMIYVSKTTWTTSLKLALKGVAGGIAFGLSCATSIIMVLGTQSVTLSVIFGGLGFILGTYIIFSQWLRYELYDKRLLPYITRKAQGTVDKLRESSKEGKKQTGEVKMSTRSLPGQIRPLKLIVTATFTAFFLAIIWAILGAITGGSDGLLLGALLGGLVGGFLGVVGWMMGWIFKWYYKEDSKRK